MHVPSRLSFRFQSLISRLVSIIALLLLAACVPLTGFAQQSAAATNTVAAPQSSAMQTLNALFAAEWDYRMRENPTQASALGDRRFNDRWEDLSLAAIKRRHEHDTETLARLKVIDREALPAPGKLN